MSESNAKQFAQHYADRGWSPLPVPYRAKIPVLSGWQNLRITSETVGRYFNGHAQNVGVLLGAASNGLTDIDLDCREAEILAPRILPATGFIFGRKSKPASHRFYVVSPPLATTQFRDVGGKMMVECRSTGAQTVVPGGSVHEEGETIEFVPGASDPAEEDGNFLLALTAKLAAACILARHSPKEGARHEFGLALAGGLARAGWDEEAVVEFVRDVCDAAGHEDVKDRENGARDSFQKVKGGQKATGWRTLIKLTSREVVGKAMEWLGIPRHEAQAEEGADEFTPTFDPLPPILTVRELVATHPALHPAVIHGVLRQGETMNVIASPKVGKSWLTLQLAISVATGRAWLNQFPTERGDVLIIDNELHAPTSASRIPKVAAAMGVTTDEYADHVSVINLRGHLQDVITLGKFFSTIEPGRFRVIVIDALYRALPSDTEENSNGGMAQIYNAIDKYALRLGCSFVLIHHTSKGVQGGKALTDVGAGAGTQSRATDAHVVLRQHEEDGVVVLDGAVRSWAPLRPISLRWEFPLWTPDDTYDPALLRIEGRKKARKEEGEGDAQEKIVWTADLFVQRFVAAVARTADEIHIDAEIAHLSQKKSERFLGAAVASGKAFKWNMGSKAKALYSTERQATISATVENTPKSKSGKEQA